MIFRFTIVSNETNAKAGQLSDHTWAKRYIWLRKPWVQLENIKIEYKYLKIINKLVESNEKQIKHNSRILLMYYWKKKPEFNRVHNKQNQTKDQCVTFVIHILFLDMILFKNKIK